VFGIDIDRDSIASRVFKTDGIDIMIADTFRWVWGEEEGA
jgi:hypothetical protein